MKKSEAKAFIAKTKDLHLMKIAPDTKDLEEQKILKYQNYCDDLNILSLIMDQKRYPIQETKLFKRFERFMNESELAKAMTTSNTANWVPTGMSRQLIDLVQIELMVAKLFPAVIIPQGVGSLDLPLKSARSTAYKITEGSAITESSITDQKSTLTPVGIGDYVQISYNLQEDAAVATMEETKKDIANVVARAVDDCDVNGDTSVIHQDSNVTNAADHRKCWDGLRRLAIANSYTRSLSTLSAENVTSLATDMGKYAASFQNLVYLSGVKVHGKMKNIRDAQNNRVYVENSPAGPTSLKLLPGQIGTFGGSPYILSEFMNENLNASGVYDGSVTTKGGLLVFRKDMFRQGKKREIMLETDKNIVSQLHQLVASTRQIFKEAVVIASERVVNYGINIDIS
jgi:HK97 family phage major capsid protein